MRLIFLLDKVNDKKYDPLLDISLRKTCQTKLEKL